jgi:phosphoribosylaminoimidazole-succinocarboxamide synthase
VAALGPTHLVSLDVAGDPRIPARYHRGLAGRAMIVRKAEVFPIECVVRGYLAGSGWKDYQRTGAVCGIRLPAGLSQAARLPEPIFTPATKAESGHDENIDLATVEARVGAADTGELRRRALALYRRGAEIAEARGIILADTKFEFGRREGRIILVDEALTPDSSRFWPADRYVPGQSPPSFDKQFVRDWLETTTWDKASPPPSLPDRVVEQTRARYVEALTRLSGRALA